MARISSYTTAHYIKCTPQRGRVAVRRQVRRGNSPNDVQCTYLVRGFYTERSGSAKQSQEK